MEKGLLEKTGKPLSHWLKIVKDSKIEKHKAIIDFLKSEHGFTYGFANFVAHKKKESDSGPTDDNDLITNQYKGKEDLFEIYEKLNKTITKFGTDVTVTPKKGSVSYIRKRQFALVKPATKTRIDLGLKLKDVPNEGVLESSGPFGSMCTHRIQIKSKTDVTKDVIDWIKMAYEKSV
ncbi:MAG: DUF4287 domain-containing protein [Saprospiraceae bacterium]|nr:DUF4287 domain-containing protein [Bacteroidia bacterium]NNE16183.1 DUF4287 domain-containing protein [Saprospiraceae bacterium]NNL91613.1 DUF4287 domain-containing protein [Saprospiraceae bacterium]